MRVETEILVKCIEQCFDLSMDGRLTQAKRLQMLALGKRLRGSLINIITATFPGDLASVAEANALLSEINQTLADTNAAINKIVDTIKDIDRLIKHLDKLLSFAVAFL